MLEQDIERYLQNQVKKKLGGMVLEFVSPGLSGPLDRVVLLPGGWVAFVEIKAPTQKLRKLQAYAYGMISTMGFEVRQISTRAGVDAFVLEMGERICPKCGEVSEPPLRAL